MRLLAIIWLLMFSSLLFAEEAEINREEIRGVVKEHLKDIRVCYEAGLQRDSKLQGKVVMDWGVDGKGKVTKANANKQKTTLKDEKVLNCITESLQSWSFPATPSGNTMSVSYPFFFSNKNPLTESKK